MRGEGSPEHGNDVVGRVRGQHQYENLFGGGHAATLGGSPEHKEHGVLVVELWGGP